MTTPLPVMFRAGRRAAETVGPLVTSPRFTMPYVLMADVSEFQPQVADAVYLAWSKAIIIRAMYGDAHDDLAWYGGERRADLLAGGALFLGIYQYVVAGQAAATQAQALAKLLGGLNPGEVVIADIEEGAGSQQVRWQAWAQVIHDELGFAPMDYSGLNFAATHGLQPADWVAAYQATEPSVAHKLWQFTDSFMIPGVGKADCSVFHGTIGQLQALAFSGSTPAPDWTDTMIMALPTLAQGSVDQPGSIFYVSRAQALVKVIGQVNGLAAASGIATDGNFGPATAAGVKAVQGMFGLTQDGIVGPTTWHKLVAGT